MKNLSVFCDIINSKLQAEETSYEESSLTLISNKVQEFIQK